MTWLDPIGVVVGLVIAIPVCWTWWDVVFGRRHRERRWFRQVGREPGSHPTILIVDLLAGKDIRAAVESFRQQDPALRRIAEDRVFLISRRQHLGPDDMADVLHDIRNTAARILASGSDVIHYFHAGPAAAATMVGAEFANGARVLVYQYESGAYRCFGPLRGGL